MAYLKHLVNQSVISIYELADHVTIGRHQDCHIRLDEATISAKHAEIEHTGTKWLVRDLDSTNGIVHDGTKMSTLQLIDNTRFSLGTHDFIFIETLSDDLVKTLKIRKSWIPGVFYTE